VSLTAIGFFAFAGVAYTLKFLWAPFLDRPLPVLTRALGRRRSWGLVIQLALAVAIFSLGASDPLASPWSTALLASLVAFLSASQDIVIDALRVELLKDREQGAGAAATQIGYRGAMIASTAGALYLATYFGWFWTYAAMAAGIAVGTAGLLLAEERSTPPLRSDRNWFATLVLAPFLDFLNRHAGGDAKIRERRVAGLARVLVRLWAWRRAFLILVFVVVYKLGDAMAGHMSGPFYIVLGFSKIEIANITKVFGVLAGIAGIVAGGSLVYRLGVMRGLLICGVLQGASNLLYLMQAGAGHDLGMLTATIGMENFASGMGSAAFVAYLSGLCNRAFTATQYALLSALASVGRTTLSATGGWLIDAFGWVPFFVIAASLCLPGLALLLWLMHAERMAPPAGNAATA
jgi:PAT family beta-lactamase induction signal transducer AmpG